MGKLLTLNKFLELVVLISIGLEDQRTKEISIYKFLVLLLLTASKILLLGREFPWSTLLLANGLYLLIFLLAKGNFGLGDVALNGILALNFSHPLAYFSFFTLTFALGALILVSFLYFKKLGPRTRIAFAKYIIGAYYLVFLLGGSLV